MEINSTHQIYRVGTASYLELARHSAWAVQEYWRRFHKDHYSTYSFPWTTLEDLSIYHVTFRCVVTVFLIAVALTALRIYLTHKVFMPWAHSLQAPPKTLWKIPENMWKGLYYTITSQWILYILVWNPRYPWFFDPLSSYDNWSPRMDIPFDLSALLALQFGYYLHSLYATMYLDTIRKDTPLMMSHHFLTLLLVGISYTSRRHMEGALVLLCHDLCDVFLELWKFNSNLRRRAGGKHFVFHDWAATLAFSAFVVSWFVCRLYFYPLKVMYLVVYGHVALGIVPTFPFYPLHVLLLTILLAMNAYWFSMVVVGLFKYALGTLTEIDDTREFDYAGVKPKGGNQPAKESRTEKSVSNGVCNGSVPTERKNL